MKQALKSNNNNFFLDENSKGKEDNEIALDNSSKHIENHRKDTAAIDGYSPGQIRGGEKKKSTFGLGEQNSEPRAKRVEDDD